mgnify:CR=1 FL=1
MASLANNNADTQLPQEMVDFLNKAWTCFHAIEVCKNWLNKAGYTEIKERSIFKGQLKQGGKYYFTASAKINPGTTAGLIGSGMRLTVNGSAPNGLEEIIV